MQDSTSVTFETNTLRIDGDKYIFGTFTFDRNKNVEWYEGDVKYVIKGVDRIVYRNSKGELHREDGPAVESYSGDKYWYLNGKRHREDGSAIEYADGTKQWYINDKCHREDGPAIEYPNGNKYWYLNGKLHRTDGPAVITKDKLECWVDGVKKWEYPLL